MKSVILREGQLSSFFNGDNEVTFYEFLNKTKTFLKNLLEDPMKDAYDKFFDQFGLNGKDSLIVKLRDGNLLRKSERISEEPNKDGKKVAYYHVTYHVPKADFEKNIRRIYDDFIEKAKKKKQIKECDCGGCMGGSVSAGDGFLGGATNTQSTGQYTVPFGGVQRRTVYNIRKRKNKKKKR